MKKHLDGSPISKEEWARYEKDMKNWREKYKGRLTSFEASMSMPNEPGYYRSNND